MRNGVYSPALLLLECTGVLGVLVGSAAGVQKRTCAVLSFRSVPKALCWGVFAKRSAFSCTCTLLATSELFLFELQEQVICAMVASVMICCMLNDL